MNPNPSSADKKLVLIVAEYGVLNGGERSLLAVLPHLQKRGWEFVALLPPESEFEAALHRIGVPTRGFITHDTAGKRYSQEQLREQLREHFLAVRPAIVHANSLATSRLCGPVTNGLEIPSIGYLRDIMKMSRQAIKDINYIDQVIAVSQATLDWHVGQGLDPSRGQVIYNGVDLETFFPLSPVTDLPEQRKSEESSGIDIGSELGIEPGSSLVLFVGQIGMRKGVDLLIEAFLVMAEQRDDLHLLIVGERNSTKQEAVDFENRIREQVQPPNCPPSISKRVHWLGRRSDVAALMRQSALLIHPARQEPFGRVLLEAAASGLSLITTDVGGSAEMLRSLDFHRIVQPFGEIIDSTAIGRRALELLGDDGRRKELSNDLRKLAESCYADSESASRLGKVYRDLSG